MAAITVADVLRDALPEGTEVLAGAENLPRAARSVAALRLRGGFGHLEPGAVAILSLETLRLLPAHLSAAQAIHSLAEREVAAVVIRGVLESYQLPVTARMAEWARCALLQLPPGSSWPVSVVEALVGSYLAQGVAAGG